MAKICVPVCVRRIDELKTATQQAAGLGDVVELRLDCLEDPEAALHIVRELINQSGTDLIVTMRAPEQGGAGSHSYDERRSFWKRAGYLPKVLFDIEFELPDLEDIAIDWSRVICSHHDFSGVPPDIEDIYGRMALTLAHIIKIATQ